MANQTLSNWCTGSDDSRRVVSPSGRVGGGVPTNAPANAPGGIPAFGSSNPPPMPFGAPLGGSVWPFPGSHASPASEIYGGNLLLNNRHWVSVGSPAYTDGFSGNEMYNAAGILNLGGKGSPEQLVAPVHSSNLPKDLRYPCPAPAYNPLNPRASRVIAERTANLMKVVDSCAFVNRKYPVSPFLKQPREGREFQEMHSLLLTSMSSATNTLVGSFTVPMGMDGVLNRVIFSFTGTGLVEGSGGLLFRVKINSVYARNLGAVPFQYGSLQNAPYIIPGYGIKLVSGQLVQLVCFVPSTSAIGGALARINMSAFGWYIPRK